MTIAEHAQINGILITAFGLLTTALVGFLCLLIKYYSAKIQHKIDLIGAVQDAKQISLTQRVERNAARLDHMENGGGTAKITDTVRALGLIPALTHGIPMNRRKTDRVQTPPTAPAATIDAPAPAAAPEASTPPAPEAAGVLTNYD